MTNKLIFPFLIILFSIIIIYGILNIKYNNTFLKNIEKFENNYLERNKNKMITNLLNNNNIIIDFANGNWSWFNTKVDPLSNYSVTNTLTIKANNSTDSSDLGTISFPIDIGNGVETITFNIVSILNDNLIATIDNVINIHIKFTNIFTNNTNINPTYTNIQNVPNAIVTMYFADYILTKFASYKIYNNTVGAEVYRIVTSNDIYIDSIPPTFDFATYNILISSSYQYPTDYASLLMNGTNSSISEIIQNNYLGNLQFSIQRVYMSPAELQSNGSPTQIITIMSNQISLSVSPGEIPSQLIIVPFQDDKEANNLTNFFEPLATIVYFYKYTNKDAFYYYNDPNFVTPVNSNVALRLKNNANNMFQQNITSNMLNTVTKKNLFNYNLIQLGTFPSTGIDKSTTVILPDNIY